MANLFADYYTKKEFCSAVPGGPIAERTADNWHKREIGPPRIRIGNVVLYPKVGVQAWLDEKLAEAEEGAGAWRGMGTAPKDGSRVLGWREGWDGPAFVRWAWNPRTETTFWNDALNWDAYSLEKEPPTHWLPSASTLPR